MHINVKSPTQESYFGEFARVGGLRFFASTTVNQQRIQEASPDKLLFKNVQLKVRTRLRQYLKVYFPSKGKIITVAPLHHGHVCREVETRVNYVYTVRQKKWPP